MKFSYKKKGDDVHIDADGSVSEVAIALSMMKDSGGGVQFHGPEAPVVQRAVEHLFPIAGEIELPMPQLPPTQHHPQVGYPGSPPMPMPALPPAQEYPAIAPSHYAPAPTQMPIPVPTTQVYPQTREEVETMTALRSLDRVTGLQTPVPYPVPAELPTQIQPNFPTRVAPTRQVRAQKPKSKVAALLDSTISNYLVAAIVIGLTVLYVHRGSLPFLNFNKPNPAPSPSASPSPGEAQIKNNINPIPFPPRIK